MLLKGAEPNALNLRSIRAAVVALRHVIHVVAAFVFVVLLEHLS